MAHARPPYPEHTLAVIRIASHFIPWKRYFQQFQCQPSLYMLPFLRTSFFFPGKDLSLGFDQSNCAKLSRALMAELVECQLVFVSCSQDYELKNELPDPVVFWFLFCTVGLTLGTMDKMKSSPPGQYRWVAGDQPYSTASTASRKWWKTHDRNENPWQIWQELCMEYLTFKFQVSSCFSLRETGFSAPEVEQRDTQG